MNVWSAEKFARGEINTWPFEHEHILGFRGTSREIFFPKEHSSSMKNLPGGRDKKLASVLRTRYLIPANNNGNTGRSSFQSWKKWYVTKLKDEEGLSDKEAERVWKEFLEAGKQSRDPSYDEKLDTRKAGNFFAPRNVVEEKGYYRPDAEERILLRAYLPAEKVTLVNRLKNRENIRCDSLEMIRREYTKEEFREQCRIATQGKRNERVQYVTADLSLENVKGVEDRSCSESFVSLSDYVMWLKKECVWEMDKFALPVKAHDDVEEEMQFLKDLEYELEKIKYYLKEIDRNAHRVREITEQIQEKYDNDWRRFREPRKSELNATEAFLTSLEKCVTGRDVKGPGYPEVRKHLYELLEKQADYFSSRDSSPWSRGQKSDLESRFKETSLSGVEELFRNIDSHLELAQGIETEIEEIRSEEKQKLNQNSWNEEQYEKERRIEHKIDARLAKEILKLPNLSSLEHEADQKRRKAAEEKQKVSNGGNPPGNNFLGLEI